MTEKGCHLMGPLSFDLRNEGKEAVTQAAFERWHKGGGGGGLGV